MKITNKQFKEFREDVMARDTLEQWHQIELAHRRIDNLSSNLLLLGIIVLIILVMMILGWFWI